MSRVPRILTALALGVLAPLCLGARLALAASAGTGGNFTLPPETEGVDSGAREEQKDFSKDVYPNWGVQAKIVDDQISLAFPQPEAVFNKGADITLGWQPFSAPKTTVERYDILITSDEGFFVRKSTAPADIAITSCLFRPPDPARYSWQVRALLSDGNIVASVNRYFTVLP